MNVATGCGSFFAFAALFGYVASQITTLVYSAQAIANKGESTCTESAFKWVVWILISSVLFTYNLLNKANAQKRDAPVKFEDVVATVVVQFMCSLGFALGTQFEYLDECDGQAHHAMLIYMWSNYAMCICIIACCACCAISSCCEKSAADASV